MNEKDFKRLGKNELINMIYQLKKTEEELRQQLDEKDSLLKKRDLKIEKSGSIAEAALAVNEIFESAQQAADDYLRQIRANHAEIESRCAAMLEETEAKCKAREEETETKCRKKEQETETLIAEKWDSFRKMAEDYINTHAELANLLQQ